MASRFDGKNALVTGAGKGLGRGIAIKLAELGAKVHAISRTQEDLDSLKQEVPDVEVYNVDLADWDRTRSVVQSIGPVDLLVNNAGITNWTSFLQVTKQELDNWPAGFQSYKSLFDINYKATFNVSQVVAKGMVERGQGGSIVNMSSINSLRAIPNHTIYCSAKGAMDQLTRTLALELGPHKIRVNSVNPTAVMTVMGKKGFGAAEKQKQVISRTPLGRIGEVEDIVSATVFLLSNEASMINGVVLPVDGGMTATL